MKSYWPTAGAIENDPGMAEVMNNIPKIVFSKTLQRVAEGPYWKNIALFHEIEPEEIVKLKEQEGKGITILGNGTIVQQLANFGLIDEYQLLVVPVVLGVGKSLFKDVKKMNLKLLDARTFRNGIVLLRYQPIK
jgi:dihydrofolate reductase